MEITKFKKLKNNLYEVIFQDKTKLKFYDDTIIKFNLLINKKIDANKLKEILNYNNGIDAYYKALKYINIRLRTKNEITKYLTKNNYDKKIIDEVIDRLEKEKYLDDDLYIRAYINDQVTLTLKGPMLIYKELVKLGFAKDKIQNYLGNFTDDVWQEKITKIIGKKIKSNHNLSSKMLKINIKNYLINQGFNSEIVNKELANFDYVDSLDILEKEYMRQYRKLKNKYQGKELSNKIKYNLYKKGFEMSRIEDLLTSKDEF